MSSAIVRSIFLLPLFYVPVAGHQPRPETTVRLTVATLHAAALTQPRTAADSVDGPYFLVSIVGPGTKARALHLPAKGHLRIHQDQALGSSELVDLRLNPGDSARLLISVLEARSPRDAEEFAAAERSSTSLTEPTAVRDSILSSALSPLTGKGAHWLGSAALVLTNEAGEVQWRGIQCVASCKVLSGGASSPLSWSGKPASGVVELSGAGGIYHLQLQGSAAQ
ncbi:MAG TPA: hypothetical protein VGG76_03485 [Gemmatimonadaceae bacterium]|jgi:hypothetical protein